MGTGRRAAAAALVLGAAILIVTSAAWACTSTAGPTVQVQEPAEAQAGAAVALVGTGWDPKAPVDLFFSFDGAQTVQPALATVMPDPSGAIAALVTVPQTTPGVHYVAAQQGAVMKPAAFEVQVAGAVATTPAVAAPANAAVGSPHLAASAATSGAAADPATTPSLGGGAVAAVRNAAADDTAAAVAPAAPPAATAAAAATAGTPVVEATVPAKTDQSPRVVTNDLWSGYATAPAPGLPDLRPASAPGSGTPTPATAMAVAVVALALGFGLSEGLTRRRAVRLDGGVTEI